MLSTVFNSMNDGVLLLDHAGIQMYNTAARQLLGRPILTGKPASWAEALGLSAPEGGPLDEDELRGSLFPAEPSTHRRPDRGPRRAGRCRAHPRAHRAAARDPRRPVHDGAPPRRHRPAGPPARAEQLRRHGRPRPARTADGAGRLARGRPGRRPQGRSARRRGRPGQGPRREPADAPGDRGLAELHRRPERPAAPHRREAGRRSPTRSCESRRARWAGGDEPRFILDLVHSVQADPGLLRQLLDNLVENAIKYTAADRAPWVQVVSARDVEPGWVTRRRHRPRDRGPGGSGGADLRGVPPRTGRRPLRRHRASASRSPDGSRPRTAGR